MYFIRLVLRNALRHKLRTMLTIVGIVVAITAFGLLRTIVDAWYAGANASSSARLVTRSSVSLVFSLPLTYAQKIRQVPGVTGGLVGQLVRRRLHHRAQFLSRSSRSIAPTYLDMYPEFVLSPEERKAFLVDRQGAIVGRKLADTVRLEGRRPDSAARHDLSRARGPSTCAASTTAPSRRPTRSHDVLPLGTI